MRSICVNVNNLVFRVLRFIFYIMLCAFENWAVFPWYLFLYSFHYHSIMKAPSNFLSMWMYGWYSTIFSEHVHCVQLLLSSILASLFMQSTNLYQSPTKWYQSTSLLSWLIKVSGMSAMKIEVEKFNATMHFSLRQVYIFDLFV